MLEDPRENAMVRHEAAEALGAIADEECIALLKQVGSLLSAACRCCTVQYVYYFLEGAVADEECIALLRRVCVCSGVLPCELSLTFWCPSL